MVSCGTRRPPLAGLRTRDVATARTAVHLEVHDPATGAVVWDRRLAAGERFTIDRIGDGVVVSASRLTDGD